jgi:carboxymethylenebutenolidase
MPESWDSLNVDGSPMSVLTASPEGDGPFPGIVVIQQAGGMEEFLFNIARNLANEGFVAIAPELYHRQDPDENAGNNVAKIGLLRDDEVIRDVNAAVAFLKSLDSVSSEQIGLIGFCMGGRVAYLMPGVTNEFKASIPFYGGNTKRSWGNAGPTPFDQLSKLKCPILGFFGEIDENPSPSDMQEIDSILTKASVPHEFHAYPGAGHAYMDFTNPARQANRGPNEEAAKKSWPIAVEFLKRHLG